MSSLTSEESSETQSTGTFETNQDEYNSLFINPLIHLIENQDKPFINFPAIHSNNLPVPDSMQAFHNTFQTPSNNLNPLAQSFSMNFNTETTQPKFVSTNQHKKLFVGNLPANTGLPEVLDLFKQFGRVNEQLSTVKDDNYAFIHYYSERDAECAQRALNDSYFKNRYIRVQYSTSTGHIKKTKTFDFSDEKSKCFESSPFFNSTQSSFNIFNPQLSQPLSTISQFSNKFPSSNSMYDISGQHASHKRPITGRSIPKSATSATGFNSMPPPDHSKSLLIPANSRINFQNQLQQLYQLQLLEQRKFILGQLQAESCENAAPASEFRLFKSNANLFEFENIEPSATRGQMVKSSTMSSFLNH